MSLKNKVILFGNVGRDVEITQLERGIKASVSLATNEYYTNAQGEKVSDTQWHNLVVYGKLAEIFQKHITKGKEIAIEGKIVYRNYEDKEGIKRYITEIRVEELIMTK